MSSGNGGWPPGDAGRSGRGGRHGGNEAGADQDQGQYLDESGYDWSEASGRSQGDSYGRGRPDQYGYGAGKHSGRQAAPPAYDDGYSQDGFGRDPYSQGSYGDSYGQGWQSGGHQSGDQHGPDDYDQGAYGQGSYGETGLGSYGEPGYSGVGYGHGPDQYARGSYGRDAYGQDGYSQPGYHESGYGQDGYGQDGYGNAGYGHDAYGRPDSYGQGHDGYGSTASSYPPPAGYQPSDGYIQDNGYFGQPSDTGSFGRSDTGSFGRAETGPVGRADTGPFGRPDTGSFGRAGTGSAGTADAYLSSQPDPLGPPAASLRRTDLGGGSASQLGDDRSPFGVSQGTGRAGGYDQWHDAADDVDGWGSDDAAEHDGDWQDDPDSGLLSRRFGEDDSGRGSGRGSGRRAGRVKRPKRVRGKAAFTAAILAGALVLGAVADFGYERYQTWHTHRYGDYPGSGFGQVKFTVPAGAVLDQLGPALMQKGIIMELRPYDSAAAAAANATRLQPGVYLLHHHMNSALVVRWLLSSGHRSKDQLTIIEGTRASAIAQALAKQTGIPVSQFTHIIDHPPASLGLPSWARGKTAEGFLFPDTYTLAPKMTALQILQMMVTEFKQKVGAINLVGAAHKVFTTPWHALIVASLIQAEGGNVGDFGKISRVVWNRLLRNMPLEFDSTVFYAMGKYGTAVNAQQRNFPSPYNTYLHTGLPPGPIGNPGVAAMNAAVHAAHGPWLYFITDTRHKPYKTYFTASLSQLQAWQREFQN